VLGVIELFLHLYLYYPKAEKEEESLFTFFGLLLVRGCPKAYHPACIKRDEAFFKSRAKWNCGML
jgi:hypothetical protein